MSDPCSVAHCGHKARCVNVTSSSAAASDAASLTPDATQPGDESNVAGGVTCACEDNFEGDPFDRCYPATPTQVVDCDCRRLIFSTHNPLAASKHTNSYGEFFLYDIVNGSPVYQHFAGIEYLYERGGHWLISDKIGLQVSQCSVKSINFCKKLLKNFLVDVVTLSTFTFFNQRL